MFSYSIDFWSVSPNTVCVSLVFEEVFCSALIPFPGSRAFDLLKDRVKKPDTDVFDPEELKKSWVKEFCNVGYNTINFYVDKILNLGDYTITIRKDS